MLKLNLFCTSVGMQDVGAAGKVPEEHAASGDGMEGKPHGPKVSGGGADAHSAQACGSGDSVEAAKAADQQQHEQQQQSKPKARRGGLFACFACGA